MIPDDPIDCKKGTIPSMGHSVWASSDGTWTTQLPLRGKTHHHMLSMATLCTLWRRRPLSSQLWGKLKQGETDTWRHPSTGTKVGWILEAIFSPQTTSFQNQYGWIICQDK